MWPAVREFGSYIHSPVPYLLVTFILDTSHKHNDNITLLFLVSFLIIFYNKWRQGFKDTPSNERGKMSEIKPGDVVIHDKPNVTTGKMLFYVDSMSYGGSTDIGLTQITSNPNLNWHLGLPASELRVVGHVDGKLKLHESGCFMPEEMDKFEPAY